MWQDAGNGLTRRHALRALASVGVAGLLTGCESGRTTPATPSGSGAQAPSTSNSQPSPDEMLVQEAVAAIADLASVLAGRHPKRGPRWQWIVALHLAQRDAVSGLSQSGIWHQVPTPRISRAEVIGFERQLRDDLIATAQRAHDPHLSRVLAGAAAGAAQVAFRLQRTPQPPRVAAPLPESAPPAEADLAALQQVLANEHAALYALGVLGGRLATVPPPHPSTIEAPIAAAVAAHRRRRDDLTALLRLAGAEPTPAAAAYDITIEGHELGELQRASHQIEERSALGYGWLIETGTNQRAWAITALIEAAQSLVALGEQPQPVPGSPREP